MSNKEKDEISFHWHTTEGKVRPENEDSIWLCDPNDEFTSAHGHLFGIADGMGGYALGGKASSLALDIFISTFYDSDGATPLQKIKTGIQNANLSVYQTAHKLGVGRMGTTLTVANIIGRNLFIGHVGDTRAYLIRNNKATCLTNDHSRVGELVRLKILSADKIRSHNQRSVLNKCLGFNLFVQPDVFKVSVQNDDLIIMCSDGVWSVLEDDEFAELARLTKDPFSLCHKISDLALERDHDDNLSVLVIHLARLSNNSVFEESEKIGLIPKIFRRFMK